MAIIGRNSHNFHILKIADILLILIGNFSKESAENSISFFILPFQVWDNSSEQNIHIIVILALFLFILVLWLFCFEAGQHLFDLCYFILCGVKSFDVIDSQIQMDIADNEQIICLYSLVSRH